MDPNWFYSSLAQSAAAVVGIIGGFLVSYLLGQRGMALEQRRTMLQSARAVRRLLIGLTFDIESYLGWYEIQLRPQLSLVGPITVDGFVGLARSRSGVEQVQLDPSDADLFKETEKGLRGALAGLGPNGESWFAQDQLVRIRAHTYLRVAHGSIERALGKWSLDPDLRSQLFKGSSEKFMELLTAMLKFDLQLQALQSLRMPRGFALSVVLLAFIAISSVIAPLWFLAAYSATDKLALLGFFAAGCGTHRFPHLADEQFG